MRVTRLSGEELEIDCAEDALLLDLMSVVKRVWGVRKREQLLCAGGTVLAPLQRLGGGNVCLTLVRVESCCANCSCIIGSTGTGEKNVCSGCFAVQYCSVECQKKDWSSHRRTCKETGRDA